jgi:hypothetical protein
MNREKLLRILHIVGVVAMVVGVIDPLEGSVVIAGGSILLAISATMTGDRQSKLFLAASAMIVTGVFFMFYLSSRGGIGGTSALSWWWGLLMAPYPLGWLMAMVLLIMRGFLKRRDKTS